MSQPKKVKISKDVMAKLGKISVATACGMLLKLGFHNTYVHGMIPITPSQKLLGIARTVKYLPVREDIMDLKPGERATLADFRTVDTLREGEVIVCDAALFGKVASTFGDVMTSRVKKLKGAGMVVDGAIRDIEILRSMNIPVFYHEPHAVPGPNAIWPWEADIPIQCGGVLVIPGDVIIGDEDGVVVIPQALAVKVADMGVEEEEMEAFVRTYLSKGGNLGDFYPPNEKTFKALAEEKAKNKK
jgi:5-oxopent-3-ene-1,2,5-tricarboxylate decarboxylase/2-hydroxyhepta-2,4-diene-1,7-dioate isomerase